MKDKEISDLGKEIIPSMCEMCRKKTATTTVGGNEITPLEADLCDDCVEIYIKEHEDDEKH
jgi:hypothetical protein